MAKIEVVKIRPVEGCGGVTLGACDATRRDARLRLCAPAKEQGKRIGRPKAVVDIDRILSLRQQGLSLPVCLARAIARAKQRTLSPCDRTGFSKHMS